MKPQQNEQAKKQ